MGRRRMFTPEEAKERKKIYDIQYQINRSRIDPEYRAYKSRYTRQYNRKKKLEMIEPRYIVDVV